MCTALLRLQTIIAMGVKKLIVKGDSKIMIEAMKEPLEECSNEIWNCKDLFMCFDYIIIDHGSRNRNKIAHLVVKSSFENNGLNLALGNIPRDT